MALRAYVAYDSRRREGATATIAECIGSEMEGAGLDVSMCRIGGECPDPRGYDLVIVGSPIYYEQPMRSVIEFIEENNGLRGCRVAVYIVCLAASQRIPAPIRNTVIGRYLGLVLKHIRGEVAASRAFRGWLRKRDEEVLRECKEWCRLLIEKLGVRH